MEWRSVPGYEGLYEVSDAGQLRSVSKGIISLYPDKHGRLRTQLRKDGAAKNFFLSRLMWLAFKGEIPTGYDVHHCDENFNNNCLENFELLENRKHRSHHAQGSKNPKAKLSEKDVVAIRERAAVGEPYLSMEKDFPVTRWQIAMIARGDCFKHVGGPRTIRQENKRKRVTS